MFQSKLHPSAKYPVICRLQKIWQTARKWAMWAQFFPCFRPENPNSFRLPHKWQAVKNFWKGDLLWLKTRKQQADLCRSYPLLLPPLCFQQRFLQAAYYPIWRLMITLLKFWITAKKLNLRTNHLSKTERYMFRLEK